MQRDETPQGEAEPMCSLTRLMLFGVMLFASTKSDGSPRFYRPGSQDVA